MKKINKDLEDLKQHSQLDLIDTHRTLYPATTAYTVDQNWGLGYSQKSMYNFCFP